MKLPSLQSLGNSVSGVFNRFPLQFLLSIFSTTIWWYIIENKQVNSFVISKILIICNFVFTLLLSADLFCEATGATKTKKWVFRAVCILIGVAIYFTINPFTNKADLYRVFLIVFGFHLLVSFAPFIGSSTLNGFWQYNKLLFLRFLTAAFYASMLFIGLAIALYALDGLFNANISSKTYLELFVLVSAGFSSIFFLAGLPDDISKLEGDHSYPKGLKIFTQYVLIPLMTIYLAILLVYEIKIIIIWSLPKGIVSSLILGYAVFGLLSLLLIHPIKDDTGNGWMRLFSRFFYLMMIPLVVLLVLAIAKRTGMYGITESRYILMALAVWLAGITLYFLLSKEQNIKLIPISLCILALTITYGPQSAFSISKYSQTARLSHLMKSKDKKGLKERSSVVRYLVQNHGLLSIQAFTKADLETIEAKIEAKNRKDNMYSYQIQTEKLDTAFALLRVKDLGTVYEQVLSSFHIENANGGAIDVMGYDAMFPLEDYSDSTKRFNGTTMKITQKVEKIDRNATVIKVELGREVPIVFNLGTLTKEAYQAYENRELKEDSYRVYLYPSEKMQFTKETANYQFTLIVNTINGNYNLKNKKFEWVTLRSYLLLKQKK